MSSLFLNIIVECTKFVSVLFQESEGIMVAKVFKLDEGVLTVSLDNRCHELVDEVVIFLASDPFMPQTNVINVIQQLLSRKIKYSILQPELYEDSSKILGEGH